MDVVLLLTSLTKALLFVGAVISFILILKLSLEKFPKEGPLVIVGIGIFIIVTAVLYKLG